MSNIDAAFGLRPYSRLGSSSHSTGMTTYKIQTSATAGVANKIYNGQPVIPLANGLVSYSASAAGGTVSYLGVLIGCDYIDLNGKPQFANHYPGTAAIKASTEATVRLASDPDQLFLINCNAAAADTLVHANANFATSVTGDASTFISAGELAVSTANTTNTLNLRIIGFEDTPASSDASVAGRLAIVMINNHFHRYAANGLGVGL